MEGREGEDPAKGNICRAYTQKRLKDVVDALLWRASALIKTVVELLLVHGAKKKKKKKLNENHSHLEKKSKKNHIPYLDLDMKCGLKNLSAEHQTN